MLSDLYALGVVDCDNMLMLLGISQKLTEHDRDIVVPLLIQGFTVGIHGNNSHFSINRLCHLTYAEIIWGFDELVLLM